jgi:hypothetical protein
MNFDYNDKHRACPKCGNTRLFSTYVEYIMNGTDSDCDRNRVECSCGWKGITHDCVPVKPLKE